VVEHAPPSRAVSNIPVQVPSSPELNTHQLLLLLKESPYPSVRELSVKRLVNRGEINAAVAEGLYSAATNDNSPGVRAASLRGLMTLRVTGPALITAAHQLQSDRDLKVRNAAHEVSHWLEEQSAAPASSTASPTN
jgi:hypothetical protein